MIEWFRQVGRASRNLARIARQNPVWAVQGLVFAPFRFARHLFGVLVLTIAVAVVLILGSNGLMWYFGLSDIRRSLRSSRCWSGSRSCSCRCGRSSTR